MKIEKFIANGIVDCLVKAFPAKSVNFVAVKSEHYQYSPLIPARYLEEMKDTGMDDRIREEIGNILTERGIKEKVLFGHGTVGWYAYWLPC